MIANGPGTKGLLTRFNLRFLQPWMSQSAAAGALPTLYAATAAEAEPAGYYGPRDLFELKGPPVPAVIGRRARDAAVAARLWDVSNQLVGASWPEASSGKNA